MAEEIDLLVTEVRRLDGAMNAVLRTNQEQANQIEALHAQLRQASSGDLFKIPDPIKGLPPFDGNKKQLTQWLQSAKSTLALFETNSTVTQKQVYLQAVINKISGTARDIICVADTISTFEEVEQILTHALGDRKEIAAYKSMLWRNKMSDKVDIHTLYKRTCETVQNIKNLAKQKEIYRHSWTAIEQFIEEDALAAFLTGLSRHYFGYAQSAKPTNFREAYAFLCQFTSNETLREHQYKSPGPQNSKPIPQTRNQFPKQNPTPYQGHRDGFNKPPPFVTPPNAEPMDVDQSLRSRLTFNKKLSHNNVETDHDPDPQTESAADEPEDDYDSPTDEEFSINVLTTIASNDANTPKRNFQQDRTRNRTT